MKQLKKLSKTENNKPQVVVIGGGTGTFVVLSGLKNEDVDLTAIVTVADSGGSTGRLRDEFGFLPVGDLRQSLAALAKENDQSWIRQLLLYRFSSGKELKGHNLGNLILTALQDMAGSTPKALEVASKIFRLDGHIYPSTIENVQLVTHYENGTTLIGEHHLDEKKSGGQKIKSVNLKPEAKIYSKAKAAIERADIVIIGPGDLYGSLLPNLIVKGAKEAFAKTKAKIIYIVNLMTRFTQTHQMTASDHVSQIAKYLGRKPDIIIINRGKIPSKILKAYQQEHEFPVKDDLPVQQAGLARRVKPGSTNNYQVVRGNFVSTKIAKQASYDVVQRSLLRHDRKKLTRALIEQIGKT